MKAVWNGTVIAEAPTQDLMYIEQNWYFPPESLSKDFFRASDTPYNCPWKGDCQYFEVGHGNTWSKDSAWSYPHPYPSAFERTGKDFTNYVAFWRDVTVVD